MFRARLVCSVRARRVRFESLEDRNMPAIVIDVGHHFVKPNTTGESVDISVSSTEASDPLVAAFSLKAQVGKGGFGPVFEGVQFGSLWNTFPHDESSSWDGNTAQGQVSFNDGLDAKANGSLVEFKLDTTGVHVGSFALNLMATAVDNSSFFETNGSSAASVILNGTVQVLSSWQNHQQPTDANGDGVTSPIDALYVINALNTHGSGQLAPQSSGEQSDPTTIQLPVDGLNVDVNGDGLLTPIDLVIQLNCLNKDNCVSEPAAIAAAPKPADPGASGATGVITLPPEDSALPADEPTQETVEEPALPDEESAVDPPTDESPLPADDAYTADDEEPAFDEYLNELFAMGQLDELIA
ncbi:MAG: hypothetical protein CMJ64_10605 [Planctomycetaceae bacterium]|nr:hypothetical protein [Planctomycetaceae bacterium]